MIKLVAFDWNGTLFSDTQACFETDNHVLKVLGGRPVTLKEFRETITIPSIDFYVNHGVDRKFFLETPHKWGELFHPLYEKRVSKCRSRSGARELLSWLGERGIKSIVFSNHSVDGIDSQLKRLKLKGHVSALLANTDLNKSNRERNKLQKIKDYVQAGGYKKQEVLIVGDSPEEAEIARELNIKSVLITEGYYSTQRLRAAKPDYLVNNLTELIGIIKSL